MPSDHGSTSGTAFRTLRTFIEFYRILWLASLTFETFRDYSSASFCILLSNISPANHHGWLLPKNTGLHLQGIILCKVSTLHKMHNTIFNILITSADIHTHQTIYMPIDFGHFSVPATVFWHHAYHTLHLLQYHPKTADSCPSSLSKISYISVQP